MKLHALRIARSIGLFAFSGWLTRYRLRILAYHGIWFLDGHYGNNLFMSPDKFRSRMAWLNNSKYAVTPLDDAVRNFKSGNSVPYTTVITIDDGWYGTYKHMLPYLEQESLPASLYVYTGAVESQDILPNILIPALIHLSKVTRLLINVEGCTESIDLDISNREKKQSATKVLLGYWRQLDGVQGKIFCRELAGILGFDYDRLLQSRQFSFMSFDEISDANRRGLDIQLHTHTHAVDLDTPEKIVTEIIINRDKLTSHVKSSLNHFCYPSGISSDALYIYLENNGIISATLTETGLVNKQDNPYSLKRILDGELVSQVEFEAELSGFLELVRSIKNVFQAGK